MSTIHLVCNHCKDTFEVKIVPGLNWIARHEDFNDPIHCPDCTVAFIDVPESAHDFGAALANFERITKDGLQKDAVILKGKDG